MPSNSPRVGVNLKFESQQILRCGLFTGSEDEYAHPKTSTDVQGKPIELEGKVAVNF